MGDHQRRQIVLQWEGQLEQVENKLKRAMEEKVGLAAKEKEMELKLEQWKKAADERYSAIQKYKNNEQRKGEELERKSKELSMLKEEDKRSKGSERRCLLWSTSGDWRWRVFRPRIFR